MTSVSVNMGKVSSLPIYSISSLVKRREKGGVVFELRIASLKIYGGEFIAIVGPSGCGKSTFLDMLALVMRPDEGSDITVNVKQNGERACCFLSALGEKELAAIRKRYIGYVLQNGGLLPYLTVAENIALTARLNGQRDIGEKLVQLAGYLNIPNQLVKKPQQLSGGQRQRAAIARALIHQPLIVLADEPTAAVDKPTAIEIRDQFKKLAAQSGVSVLMVTHDESLVRPVVDRIITFDLEKPNPDYTISHVVEETV